MTEAAQVPNLAAEAAIGLYEYALVALIAVVAVLYLTRRFWWRRRANAGGCTGCPSCTSCTGCGASQSCSISRHVSPPESS